MKRLRDLGEDALIARLLRGFPGGDKLTVGPGDDCAVVDPGRGPLRLLKTDAIVEGVHFMKVQCAVSETAQISITFHVMMRTFGPKSSRMRGAGWSLRASLHSSVSGTDLRIHSVMKAGSTPTRKIQCGDLPASKAPATQARRMPQFTALCSVAAIHGRW